MLRAKRSRLFHSFHRVAHCIQIRGSFFSHCANSFHLLFYIFVQFIRTIENHNHSQIFFNFFLLCCFSLCLDCSETGWLSSLDKVILCKLNILYIFYSLSCNCRALPATSFVYPSWDCYAFFYPFVNVHSKSANDEIQTSEAYILAQPQYTSTCLAPIRL